MALLELPVEMRHEIYQYFTSPAHYAYLYRSPGRRLRHEYMQDLTALLALSKQIRDEALDYFFNTKTFIIEASLYNKPIGGLEPLPPNPMPKVWLQHVTRLLILTAIELNSEALSVGDLKAIQAMSALKELRVVATTTFACRNEDLEDPHPGSSMSSRRVVRGLSPILAVIESIPATTTVNLRASRSLHQRLQSHFNSKIHSHDKFPDAYFRNNTVDFFFRDRVDAASLFEVWDGELRAVSMPQGRFSGKVESHEHCPWGVCLTNEACMNSRLRPLEISRILPGDIMLEKERKVALWRRLICTCITLKRT